MSNVSCGIVGLPNVGKSTLFNALLKRQAALAANYPFATIDPNTGIVPVPDPRLDILAQIVGTSTIKPATVEFVDIAGLVKGASEGAGLGNKFLSHIREVDLICHVVRGFSDSDVIREGSIDPKTDRETIEMELLLADMATLEKQKEPKGNQDKELFARWQLVQEMKKVADQGVMIRQLIAETKNTEQRELMSKVAQELGLLTAKQMIYAINVDEDKVGEVNGTEMQAKALDVKADDIVIVSAKIESDLSSLSDDDQALFLSELGLEKSGLERLIQKTYALLGLQSFLTAGEIEVRAWTIRKGMTAPEAAGVIHTDFTKHFIKAVIVSYEDFVALGGWKKAKDLGKIRTEGKEYVMREGDVVEFMIGK